ncbi:MAG: hypothetical protein ACJ8ED_10900, partial [Xanthobacteraceae bacterium]
ADSPPTQAQQELHAADTVIPWRRHALLLGFRTDAYSGKSLPEVVDFPVGRWIGGPKHAPLLSPIMNERLCMAGRVVRGALEPKARLGVTQRGSSRWMQS